MELAVIENQERILALQEREYSIANAKFEMEAKALQRAEFWAKKLASSQLVPKDFLNRPENCFIAIQWGAELGIGPMQAPQSIAVINGRPSIWGDLALAIVLKSPLCEYVTESIDGDVATCTVKRKNGPEQSRTFSKAQAQKAGLWTKTGPWTQYPERMLQMRARGFALRDVFTDVLKGLSIAEEMQDMPTSQPPVYEPKAIENKKAEPVIELYDDEQFAANSKAWKALVESGKKSANNLIAFLSTKINFTEKQKKTILSWEIIEPAEPVDQVETTEAQNENN